MRIFRIFLQIFLFLGIIGVLLYLVGGSLWLKIGTVAFVDDVRSLERNSRQLQQYGTLCQQAPGSSDGSQPMGFQLRFTDSKHYNIELVCSLIEQTPIQLRQGSLPFLISKAPGSAGFFYALTGNNNAIVRLTSLGKSQDILLSSDTVSLQSQADIPSNSYPKSECSGFGYSCCIDDSVTGTGDARVDGVIDCPGKCFATCSSIPFIQLFASDPPSTLDTQEVTMTNTSQDIIFNYGISSAKGKINSVTIDYGDGKSDNSTQAQGIFTHTFQCQGKCRFTVKLVGTDSQGKHTIENQASTIYIVRK